MGSSARPRLRFADGAVYQLRVELEGVTPVVWRRLQVSGRASLHELHGAIQRAFGLDDADGYSLDSDGVRYLDADADPGHDTAEVALEDLGLHPGAWLEHQAETPGEPWRHRVTVEEIAPRLVGQRLPTCLAGSRAAPPDDCDGPTRYLALLGALDRPFDADAADLLGWLPEDFDPGYVDLVAINAALARLPKRRVSRES